MSETILHRKVHELKTWPVFYEKIIDGSKLFEVRKNDRNFKVDDVLFLREYDPDAETYTGRSCHKRVTYVLGDNPFFQMNNTVIMGIASIGQPETEQPQSEQMYPPDFIQWIGFEVPHRLKYREVDDKWVFMITDCAYNEYTLPELFKLWEQNY